MITVSLSEQLFIFSSATPKLNRKQRKKLKWQTIQESKSKNISTKKYYGEWSCLPDLILEIVFQYLSLRVSKNILTIGNKIVEEISLNELKV
jgi:hypothetical protein